MQARSLEAAGDLPRAFEQYRKAAIIQAGSPTYPFSYAQALLRHRRLKEADAWFRAVNRIDPSLAKAHAALGEIALEESRFDAAVQHFGDALYREPGNASFHNELGVAHALGGRYPEAIVAFDNAARLGGGDGVRANLQRARRDAERVASAR